MTMRCRNWSETEPLYADALALSGLSHQLYSDLSSVVDPTHTSIKVMTLHISKGWSSR